MARGDDKAATKAGHMAAPTSLAEAFNKTLANGEPSTHGTSRTKAAFPCSSRKRTFI